ncbi:hypothetical protein KAI58_03915 [Candidatus Gracilibacteria bacterium]|nr:hypothetical protein [Candidatus Gracilibacteria bacterium]
MNYKLFTTTTCQKCPEFKDYVSQNISFEGELFDEHSKGFGDLAQSFGIIGAPMILIFENNKEIFRTSEVYALEAFLNET